MSWNTILNFITVRRSNGLLENPSNQKTLNTGVTLFENGTSQLEKVSISKLLI